MTEARSASTLGLLKTYSAVAEELRSRGIVRTKNILGDYAETLFCRAFSWSPQPNSNRAFDAVHEGVRYQIKSRQVSLRNPSRLLGDLPADGSFGFDKLAAVIFDEDFSVILGAIMPTEVMIGVRTQGGKRPRLNLKNSVLAIDGVEDVTEKLRSAQLEF